MPKPKLSHVDYKGKEYLILNLGSHGDKVVGLLSSSMSQDDVKIVKKKFSGPGAIDLRQASEWLRDHMPHVYRNAYRSFKISELRVVKNYEIN